MSNQKLPILITIATFNNPSDAYFAKIKLENNGINCFLDNENMQMLYSNAVGGLRLKVSGSDYQKALKVLEEPTPASKSNKKSVKRAILPELFVCPHCGHLNEESTLIKSKGIYGVLELFNILKPKVVCEQCNKRFSKKDLLKKP
jgi:hypothetical protein